ncbi:zinc-ribbon domain-containing protein [Candidatus Pelagibacter sp.]|nr:zinc-ribbon domain-containing protein [Candidatus Pelagibacter sp.]
MIIECPACSKKFNIDEKLIPDEGRLLKCGNCDHTWFYKKEENLKLETESKKINEIEENKSEINIEPVDNPIKQTKKIRKKISKKSSTKESTSKELVSIDKSSVSRENNIIKKIFLIIISTIAFILLIDTFKNHISVIFPGIVQMSDSLYLVINDLKLFIKDLVR